LTKWGGLEKLYGTNSIDHENRAKLLWKGWEITNARGGKCEISQQKTVGKGRDIYSSLRSRATPQKYKRTGNKGTGGGTSAQYLGKVKP